MYQAAVACMGVAFAQIMAVAEPLETRGCVDAVTVYRGQALVSRVVEVDGPAGLRELVITDLPESVVPTSIYAESSDGVEVRSVRYRVRPVSQDVREEVRALDEQIQSIQDKLDAASRRAAVLAEHKAYLAKLEQFVAPTANAELAQGVLDAETLQQLSTFLLEQRQVTTDGELKLGIEQRDLKGQLELLQRQRKQLTAGSARSIREAVVFANLQSAEGGRLHLRYLVDQASWSPSYILRSTSQGEEVIVQYHASVHQMTGEDWNEVMMTLSTATPSLVARSPELEPLMVTLAASQPSGKDAQVAELPIDASSYTAAREKLSRKRMELEQARNQIVASQQVQMQAGADPAKQAGNLDQNLNAIAREIQILDLMVRGFRPTRYAKPGVRSDTESVSVTYELAGRTSLPSRSDQQLIQIAALPMKADFYKVATPALTNYVYNEALAVNNSQMVLLGGPVSSYLNGEFVGRGDIPTVAVGEDFVIGLGIDTSLRADRELLDRSESIQGGNRVVVFTYRLRIENFGAAPAAVRLYDRLPLSKTHDIKIELASNGKHKLSQDSAYLATQRKKGLLRWEVKIPAQAVGPQALAVEYDFRLEYDKQMNLTGVPVAMR